MAATWDPVKKRYVDDGSNSATKGAYASTGFREGEGADEAQDRKMKAAADAQSAAAAKYGTAGTGLGAAGDAARKAKESGAGATRPSAAPLSGKDQLEAMRKRRQSLTSGY